MKLFKTSYLRQFVAKSLPTNTISFPFSTLSTQDAKYLTKRIINSKNEQQLVKIFSSYEGNLNLYNITAILQKITKKTNINQQFINKVITQAENILDKHLNKKNGRMEATAIRGLVNIICYAGNLQFRQRTDFFLTINYKFIIPYLKPKQFVMLMVGLVKLDIVNQCFVNPKLDEILKQNINEKYEVGLLISVWRNIIKAKITDNELNIFFIQLILKKGKKQLNLKDYGYLVFSYINSSSKKSSTSYKQLLEYLKSYPQQLLYSSRISMFEFNIIVSNLCKLKLKQTINFNVDPFLVQLLTSHYLRGISQKRTNLRHLANSYFYLESLLKELSPFIHEETEKKFKQFLVNLEKENVDYESITSLFVQLAKREQNQLFDKAESPMMVDLVLKVMLPFDEKLENKHFQKFCYGVYLYKLKNPYFTISDKLSSQVKKEIIENRKSLSYEQIQSTIPLLWIIGIRSVELCLHFQQSLKKFKEKGIKGKEIEKRLSRKCVMKSANCLLCGQKNEGPE